MTAEDLKKMMKEVSEEVWHTHQAAAPAPQPPAVTDKPASPSGAPPDLEGHAFVPWAKKCLRGDCPSLNPGYKKPNMVCEDCGTPGYLPEGVTPPAQGEEKEIGNITCPGCLGSRFKVKQ